MGYSSNVAYVIAGKNENIITFLTVCRLKHPEVKLALDECTVGKRDDETMYIGFADSDTKWCWSYEHVTSHKALWNLAQSYEESTAQALEGRFCRVGEEEDDIENRSFGDNDLELYDLVEVSISIHVGMDLGPKHDIRESVKETACVTAK